MVLSQGGWLIVMSEEVGMRVLLVGAGAVGQVYGRHFQRGGAHVTFFVKAKYTEEVRGGFDLYPLNESRRRKEPVRFEDFALVSDLAEVAAGTWDVVVICVSSTALRRGDWFASLVDVVGDATLVSLSPGLEDRAFVHEHVPEERAVFGMIGLLSYPGPLDGETLPKPGMVYWVPPLTKMTFSGPEVRTEAVVRTLRVGGLKSKRVADTAKDMAFGGPVLQMLMAALEIAGWRFRQLRADRPLLALAHRAMGEAFAVAAKRMSCKTPLALRLLRPWMFRMATRLMPMVTPVDMERFFAKHFTKVGDQTQDTLATYGRLAEQYGVPHDAIDTLASRLASARQV